VLGGGALLTRLGSRSGAALGAAPATAASGFTMALPPDVLGATRLRAARAGALETPVLRAPARYDLIGLRWRGGAPRVELRVWRARDGWSRWLAAPAAGAHGPDGPGAHASARERDPHARETGCEPVWAGGAEAFQLRIAGRVHGLRAHFVDAGRPTRDARAVAARRAQGTASGAPPIIPRAAWADAASAPRVAPRYGEVQLAFVHHTVTANDYAAEESPAIVRAICHYHRNTNGWNDIGYNFLVDRYGQVFEGRAGGIEAAVVGAQAQGYNSLSTGVANLGNFTSAPQTEVALDALAALIAWKLPLHGVPVTGAVTVRSGGGRLNRYPAGTPVTLQRIAGHGDADATACPGAALAAQLPTLRERVAARAGSVAQLTLALAQPRVVFPEPVRLAGRLVAAGATPAAGATVQVQARRPGGFETVASVTTAADGRFTAEVLTDASETLRALWDGTGGAPLTSPQRAVVVEPRVEAAVSLRRVAAGGLVSVSGAVRPAKPAVELLLQRKDPGARAWNAGSRVRVVTRDGSFSTRVRLRKRGLYRIVARAPADARNPAAAAAPLFVRTINDRTGGAAAG